MRVWYSNVFVHQPSELGAQKLGECGSPAKFLGYPETSTGYRTYNPVNHKVDIVRAPAFREEAHACPNTTFETPADDSDDDVADSTAGPQPDDALPPPDTPHESPSTVQDQPTHTRHVPPCFNPNAFGAHGCRKEAIANAYEDFVNGIPSANDVTPDLAGLMFDDAHFTDIACQVDTNLPDAPLLCKALAGPEQDRWHSAILEVLAAIKDAGML